MRRSRWLSGGLVATLALALLQAVAAAPARAREACPAAKADAAGAVAAAKSCAGRVEVLGERSERSQTFAAADGSMVLETSAVPKRLKRPDGTWADLDATLRRQADGAWAAAVAQTTARVSAGGGQTLVSVPTAAGPWQLSWPAVLPAAQVAGDTATYPEVFPGVDLQVKALPDGFTYALVVKTREALRSAALRRIPMAASGPAVRAAGDHLEVVGKDGQALLTSGAATAWDSSGDEAKVGRVGLSLSAAGEIVLTPDQAWLADPSLQLPVYVDPQWSSGSSRWTYSNSGNYSYSNLGGVARVGTNPDGTGGSWREHFEFPYGAVAGALIKGVAFKSTLAHTAACSNVQADLWRSADVDVTGRTGWTPALYVEVATGSGHAHKPSEGGGCAGDPQPDQELTFANTADFLPQAQSWANQGLSRVTLTLGSHVEGDKNGWMKFNASSTSLIVNYNRPPNAPNTAALATLGTSQTIDCYTGAQASQPWINVTNGVTFRAEVTDSDVNPGGGYDHVVAKFEWQDLTAGAGVTTQPDTPAFDSPPSAPHAFTTSVPGASLPAGHSYQWRVRGWDGQDYGPYSPWCRFGVDNATPSQPVLTSADLPAYPASAPATTKVGKAATVTVSPGGGDTDIAGYLYSVTTVANPNMPAMYVPAGSGGMATIPVVPLVSGLSKNFLSVVAIDAAGNRSPIALSAEDAAGTRQFRANAADAVTRVAGDATGDGRADVTLLSDIGGGKSALWRWDPAVAGRRTAVAPQGVDGLYASGTVAVNADVDGDGRSDTVTFTQAGTSVAVGVQRSDGNQLTGTVVQTMNGWSTSKIKAVAGDFNADGKSDVLVAYDNNPNGWLGWLFLANGTGPGSPSLSAPIGFGGGLFAWSAITPVAGDFDGDGRADVYEISDGGGCLTEMRFHQTSAASPPAMGGGIVRYSSGAGKLCYGALKFFAGNFNGDQFDDVGAVADRGTCQSQLWTFMTVNATTLNGNAITQWDSGQNAWCFGPVTPVPGDYNGDGRTDVGLVYRCCGAYQAQLWITTSTGTAFSAPAEVAGGGIGPAGTASVSLDTALGAAQQKYQVVNAGSGTCADDVAGNLQGQPCAAVATQYVTIERRGAQYVSIHPADVANTCYDVAWANTANMTPIGRNGCHGVATQPYMLAQYWTVEYLSGPPSAPVVRFVTPLSGKCLDLDNDRAAAGTSIWEYDCNGGLAQSWILRPVAS
ncbi:hypothetical protein GCM10010170_091140 [Dactylosporangium salmoneum]|uniref:Ricin B lectin domain-containing protein n=2 Tax=Dactylosporangium salmoneum TaxID=53361 RepID=A0ABP5UML5_9ACTN